MEWFIDVTIFPLQERMEELQKRAFQYKLYQKNFKVTSRSVWGRIVNLICWVARSAVSKCSLPIPYQYKFGIFSSLKRSSHDVSLLSTSNIKSSLRIICQRHSVRFAIVKISFWRLDFAYGCQMLMQWKVKKSPFFHQSSRSSYDTPPGIL